MIICYFYFKGSTSPGETDAPLGIVATAGTMKWQRLGDLVAGTVVVRDKRR